MTVRLDTRDGIATVTLDRPEKLNALSDEMYDKLYQYCNELATDDATRAVILTAPAAPSPPAATSPTWRSPTSFPAAPALTIDIA
jgi:1,4-dihydroxy-2-naphthoyl-CoA synthase